MQRHAHLPLAAMRGGTFWLQPCRANTRPSAPARQKNTQYIHTFLSSTTTRYPNLHLKWSPEHSTSASVQLWTQVMKQFSRQKEEWAVQQCVTCIPSPKLLNFLVLKAENRTLELKNVTSPPGGPHSGTTAPKHIWPPGYTDSSLALSRGYAALACLSKSKVSQPNKCDLGKQTINPVECWKTAELHLDGCSATLPCCDLESFSPPFKGHLHAEFKVLCAK